METPLRQPVNFWQWLSGQPGTLYAPIPAPIIKMSPPRSALSFIEDELERMHDQLEGLRGSTLTEDEAPAFIELTKTLSKLHDELIRRSMEEKRET
jgi:hypothetical protein